MPRLAFSFMSVLFLLLKTTRMYLQNEIYHGYFVGLLTETMIYVVLFEVRGTE